MTQISSEEAFRRLKAWSNNSLVGLTFGKYDATVNFSVRGAALDVTPPNIFLEVSGTAVAMLHFSDASFWEMTGREVEQEFSRLYSRLAPSFELAVRVKFNDKDFCTVFAEK